MSFNDILVAAGGFGLYQKCLTFGYLAFTLLMVSCTYWTQVFILLTPPHRCKMSLNDTEWNSELFNASDQLQTDLCHVVRGNESKSCENGFIYDYAINFPTFTSEHDLVCEQSYKVYLVHTLFWIGTIFGTVFFGIINDTYGRRRAYQSAVLLTLISDITTYVCSDPNYFMIARFCSAAGDGSIATIAFVLAIEHCIPSKRRLSIFVWSFVYAVASLVMVWICYFAFHWRYILMFSWFPTTLAIIMSYFIPESPSWLLTKGRLDEAVEYIQRMARVNGKSLSKDFIVSHLQKMDKGEDDRQMACFQTFATVLKSRNLRKRILCLGVLWLASCACYHGNNLEFNFLPFNMYVTYSIGAIAEIPGNFIVILVLDKLGRRWTNAGFFIAGGLFGILSANVESKVWMLILVMLMRASYASAYDITFSFSSELIPTVIRGRAISFIRTCGGLGGAAAPFIVSLAQQDPLLPLSCFGILAVVAGLLMLTLPETANQHLPQTLEEGDNFGTDQSFWLCPYSLKSRKESKENPIFGKASNTICEEKDLQCLEMKKLPKY